MEELRQEWELMGGCGGGQNGGEDEEKIRRRGRQKRGEGGEVAGEAKAD